ncbi:hypothetical protein ABG067_005550 [Albugo candida]
MSLILRSQEKMVIGCPHFACGCCEKSAKQGGRAQSAKSQSFRMVGESSVSHVLSTTTTAVSLHFDAFNVKERSNDRLKMCLNRFPARFLSIEITGNQCTERSLRFPRFYQLWNFPMAQFVAYW